MPIKHFNGWYSQLSSLKLDFMTSPNHHYKILRELCKMKALIARGLREFETAPKHEELFAVSPTEKRAKQTTKP